MNGAWSLLAPTARVVPFLPTLIAFGVGLLAVAVTRVDVTAAAQMPRLRGVGLLLAVAVAFAFDEPTGDVADASPRSRLVRASVRGGVQIAPAVLAWLMVVAGMSLRAAAPVPAGRLSLEAAGMVLAGWAVAAWWHRTRGDGRGGVVAAPVLVALVLVAHQLPSGMTLFASDPAAPWWDPAQRRGAALAAAAVAALILAMRDPLARPVLRPPAPRSRVPRRGPSAERR